LKTRLFSSLKNILPPYFFIACAGLLAFAPVSFMLRSLKNDVVALEYPINHFMSQCIRNGEIPYWFNTWAMGFPLQSNITWGIFSTPQMLFCSLFNYNIFSLHIEFMFFVLMAGWGMYYLLKKYFLKDKSISVVLACCYMLSGFVTGSGQWMLYITAAAFIPFVLSSLLQLLKFPSLRRALLFAVLYFMMFTSVYAALNIITTYCLLIFTAIYILNERQGWRKKIIQIKYLIFAGLVTALLCLPCILSSLEVLKYLSRGNPITANANFFNSNYLHPSGLSSMLFPFSSVKMSFPNTEGTMLNAYVGLFTLLVLPVAILKTIKEKNRKALILLLCAIIFLLISFGPILPLRKALNILPGFSYFRNAAIIRFYFIFLLILFLGMALRNTPWRNIFHLENGPYKRILKSSFLILGLLCLIGLVVNFNVLKTFSSASQIIKDISLPQSIFISAALQLLLLVLIFYCFSRKQYKLTKFFFGADLIINTLLCTPYFIVSSYSLPQVNRILNSEKGFPMQHEKINNVAATYTDEKMNRWNNINTFNKKVSVDKSYIGPLLLNNFSSYIDDSIAAKSLFDHTLVYSGNDTSVNSEGVKLIIQRPTHIQAQISANDPKTFTAMQNYFPGWKAYYNNRPVEFIDANKPGLTIAVPEGTGMVDFIYSKKGVWLPALLLHLITVIFLILYLYKKIKEISVQAKQLSQ